MLFVFGTGDRNNGHILAGVIDAHTDLGARFISSSLQQEVGQIGSGFLKKVGDELTLDVLTKIKDELKTIGPVEGLKGVRSPGATPRDYVVDEDLSTTLRSMNLRTTKLPRQIRIERRS